MSRSAIDTVLAELEKLGKIGAPRRLGRINNTFDCPFHSAGAKQDTPSFGVQMETGEWNCLNPACGRRGPSIQALYANLTGKPQAEVEAVFPADLGATDDLRRKLLGGGPPKGAAPMAPFPKCEDIGKSPKATAYMESRRIPKDVWKILNLFYCPAERMRASFTGDSTVGGRRIIFPIDGTGGGFMGRSIGPDPTPKWRPVSNAGTVFYDPLNILKSSNPPRQVVLVEGEFDVAACVREGLPALGCFSARIGKERAPVLQRFDKVLIMFDGDKAGREGRSVAFADHGRMLKGKLFGFNTPEGYDPASLPVGFGAAVRAKLGEVQSFTALLKEFIHV